MRFLKPSVFTTTLCFIQRSLRSISRKSSIVGQKGQGIIEYLLILTLTVAVITAISRGIGRPMGEYIDNNVLQVVKCMLRVGQFPTKSFGLCQDAIAAQLDVRGNLNNNGSNSSSSSSDTNGNGSDSSDGENGDGSDSDGSSDSSSNDSDSSSRTRVRSGGSTGSLDDYGDESPFESGTTKRVKVSNDDSAGADTKLKSNFKGGNDDTTVIVRRIKRNDGRIGGSFFIQNDENSDYEGVGPETYTATSSQKIRPSEFEPGPTGTRFAIPEEKDSGKRAVASDVEVNFSFLTMIKWMIIAAVLFFIVVFAASQLNSIRKGWTD